VGKEMTNNELRELKEWRRIGKHTALAIKSITQKWYADCYNSEGDMQRLMCWETHIYKLLGVEK
jgi:hypothetical protein